MNSSMLPEPGTRIAVRMAEHSAALSCWSERVMGDFIMVTVPDDEHGKPIDLLPSLGELFTIGWFTDNGRFRVETRFSHLAGSDHPLWALEVTGAVQVHQDRRYVRGGGGERIDVVTGDGRRFVGEVCDLAERSVRASFVPECDLALDDVVRTTLHIDDKKVQVPGSVYRLTVGDDGNIEVVLSFLIDERTATIVRTYVIDARRRKDAEKSVQAMQRLAQGAD